MLEKMHNGRVTRYTVEEENEHGNGFRARVYVESDEPLSKYVSFDLMWISEGEDTDDAVGVLISPQAAMDIARYLNNSAHAILHREFDENA